jgi:hypothetical protein
MNTSKDDRLQVNTDPNINQLCTEYRRAFSDDRITYRVRESDETRFATWTGQSRDGKKHAKDLGRQPFPWEGASDTRIRLADEVCSFMVNLSTSAISRAALNVAGIEASDHKAASAVGLYLRWMLSTLMQPGWEEELELHAEYAAQYGWSVLHVIWDRSYAQTPRTINLQTLSGFLGVNAPQQLDALTAALQDEQEYIADLLVASNEGLTRTKALKHIREIVEKGETTFELPDMVKNQARIVALRPYHEILFPPETTDLQRARAIFRREYYTLAELEAKAASGEWDKQWAEEVKKTAGQSSQVWDQGLSPVLGSTERLDDKTNLIEVIHAYSRRVTENGNPGIYMTVFSPYMEKNSSGKEMFAEHRLVTEAGDTYPFETFTREKTRRSPIESRGVSEIVRTWQAEYKAQADMVFDRSSFDTLPPLKVPLRYGQRIKVGPGVQVSEQRPGDIGWMEAPRRGADLAFTLMDHIQLRTDRYFGRPNAAIPPVETQLRQQAYVHRWLRHMSSVIGRVWDLTQVFDTDDRFALVTGTNMPLPRDPKKYNFTLHFDVRELDNEFVQKKLQAISQFVLPEDTMGIVDRTKLIRKKLQVIDPTLADELVIEQAEASQQMFDDMNNQVALMSLGNQPKFVENDPSAGIKMQFIQQIIQNNPKYQQQMQQDEQFAQLVQTFAQNLQMSVTQQQNAQIGRIGVNPNA